MAMPILLRPFVEYYSRKYRPMVIRKHTSDLHVFSQVFFRKEYDLPFRTSPKLIVDAGAYAGYSSLWFHSKYPGADIIAIEPEESNFAVLEKNTENYGRIRRVNAGLWHRRARLEIDRSGPNYAFTTKECRSPGRVGTNAVTIDGILEGSGHGRIGILKIDIEGAEKELFSENYESWLGKVDVIVIELHDMLREGCGEAFRSAISAYQWEEYRRGENIILRRSGP